MSDGSEFCFATVIGVVGALMYFDVIPTPKALLAAQETACVMQPDYMPTPVLLNKGSFWMSFTCDQRREWWTVNGEMMLGLAAGCRKARRIGDNILIGNCELLGY